ncbi:MAG: glutamate synthase large subunit [Candidatus Dadabacteria bacterium]|nr:glutamate synthase large subunit [Candidatus Dadabacteria bacterium]
MRNRIQHKKLLYNPLNEHDACGVGFVADISGEKSHYIVELAIECVIKLTHRGAVDADAKTGDGAGILTQIPKKLFKRVVQEMGCGGVSEADIAVGMIFLPSSDPLAKERCKTIVEEVISSYDLGFYGWRKVPIDPHVLGDKALDTKPEIFQVLIGRAPGTTDDEFERTLYLARKKMERHVVRNKIEEFYIPSLSHKTIVYKGLLVAPQLRRFYLDLKDPDFQSSLAVFHQRYSTNTFPNWYLAQPFRIIAHNGEINTLRGNINWMRAREPELHSEVWKDKMRKLLPVIQEDGSDSACLDNMLELLVQSGRDIRHSMMMLIPEAYEKMADMDPELRGFYEYHSCLSEPWDGPASVVFSDGVIVGASLDRNGLRPARYVVTDDGIVIMGSEVGMVDVEPSKVVEKGRLGPGKMIAVDTENRVLLKNDEIKSYFAKRRAYADWVEQNMFRTEGLGLISSWSDVGGMDEVELIKLQKAFGYSLEDIERILEPMATNAKEPVGSMGDDTPLSVLSTRPQLLYTYFKQRFAQVTNPPIDSLREQVVMSLSTSIGPRKSILEETPEHAKVIKFPTPILNNEELKWLRGFNALNFSCAEISILFNAADGPGAMEGALQSVCRLASEAIDSGKTILVLSDKGVDGEKAPIPALLAVSAVHHHLIRKGKRKNTSIIIETGEAREDHHFACLLGYGASLINPYLVYESVANMIRRSNGISVTRALENYRTSAEKGILKIMSKMGISTVASYRGAQIFEAIGISKSVIDQYFTGSESRIEGIDLDCMAVDVLRLHGAAFAEEKASLIEKGYFRFRKTGEYHALNPTVFKALHKVAETGSYEDYQAFEKAVDSTPPIGIRDLLEFKEGVPVPLEEVEPIEAVLKRFVNPGMSYGALSAEAHETIAIGMNRLGGKTCSGEGGESPARFHRRQNGDWPNSLIKQVASGRFGVTPEYLASAKEIEIKMAQGSKPGEGGQLPGIKVTPEIAEVRYSIPGVTLISPPPHHDIYSIEDLAQLIYDLKHANTRAKVAVKLVSEAGVGTVAAGVVKAYADLVHISGHEGGTGASPLGSMKHAGISWELGLSETQQVLVLNDLRGRVILRVDGGFKTARDVVVAAMLGAEQYGFGTAALVAVGCVMARQCHLNTCPVGVATQKPELRAKFQGTPENMVNYFTGIAMGVRDILSQLGFRKLEEVIGRAYLLKVRSDIELPKTSNIDLGAVLADADPDDTRPRYHMKERNDRADAPLDNVILQDAMDSIAGVQSVKLSYPITNENLTVGAMLAGEIAYRYGDKGLPPGITIEVTFKGTAGQSFGGYGLSGMRLVLEGDANDYVGKSMHGGVIIIRPPDGSKFETHENVILGNTVLYGATGGELYAAGCAGERFGVRNSGARAVVEGLGDHGCEYMTGGVVAVIGETGRNFAAGMTGGLAFVLDEDGSFPSKYNPEHVGINR